MKKLRNKISAINCEEATKRFNDFIDNYLKGKSKLQLQHHINTCRHCFERIEFEKMLKSKVADLAVLNAAEKKLAEKAMDNILIKIFGT